MSFRRYSDRSKLKGMNQRFKQRQAKVLSITSMLPNMITILAMCFGLTAIRFSFSEQYKLAITSILIAGFLDAMDGRLARYLGSSSRFGAELDSFSDFLSFGAAPAIVMYLYSLSAWGDAGWAIVLFFTVCMSLRLARFNVRDIEGHNQVVLSQKFFTGVPAPCAALLGLLPVILEQAFSWTWLKNPFFTSVVLIVTGGLMVSRIPTFSLKKTKIHQKIVLPLMLLLILCLGLIYTWPWHTLSMIALIYLGLIPFSMSKYKKLEKAEKINIDENGRNGGI